MKMRGGFLLILILLFLFVFAYFNQVDARSGCCSWHGGVCGCGCCDGTPLSATCAPYYPGCSGSLNYQSAYIPPPPRPQVYCPSVAARNTFYPNYNGTFRVFFDWDDVQTAQSYSIAMYKYAFGDPGPNIDTTVSQWWFEGIKPGKWHVAIKTGIGGYWSNICDWSIEVPDWYPPPSPSITLIPTDSSFMESNSTNTTKSSLITYAIIGGGLTLYYFINKKS